MAGEPFGTRLRSWRERAGMNQTELAKNAGVCQWHISAWERNAAIPQMVMIERLAVALGVSAVKMLTGEPANQPKRTIRLTADNFADHLATDYVASLVKGYTVPEDGIDADDWIVRKLLA
jgi:transcriptional regulator with XRE-family HTH domain